MCSLTGRSFYCFSRLIFTGLLPLLALLHGCGKSIFFADDPAVIEHPLPAFAEIKVNSVFDIELRNDSLYSIRLEGNKGLIENISFDIVADTLKLSDDNSFVWLPDYPRTKLVISMPEMRRIGVWLNSPAKLYSSDTLSLSRLSVFSIEKMAEIDLTLNTNYLSFNTDYNNFGYYILRGITHEADLRTYGSAHLDAGELHVNNASVRNVSIGDTYIHVENQLRAWLIHYGNIYYSGSPDDVVIEYMESRGRLIYLDTDH